MPNRILPLISGHTGQRPSAPTSQSYQATNIGTSSALLEQARRSAALLPNGRRPASGPPEGQAQRQRPRLAQLHRGQGPSNEPAPEGLPGPSSSYRAEPLSSQYVTNNAALRAESLGHSEAVRNDSSQSSREILPLLEHPSRASLAFSPAQYSTQELLDAYESVALQNQVERGTILYNRWILTELVKWMAKEGRGNLNDVLGLDFDQRGVLADFAQAPSTTQRTAKDSNDALDAFRSGHVSVDRLQPQVSDNNRKHLDLYEAVALQNQVAVGTIKNYRTELGALTRWMAKEGRGDLDDVLGLNFDQRGVLAAYAQHPETTSDRAKRCNIALNSFRFYCVGVTNPQNQLSGRNRMLLDDFEIVASLNPAEHSNIKNHLKDLSALARWMTKEGRGDLDNVREPDFDQSVLAAFKQDSDTTPHRAQHIDAAVNTFRSALWA